MTNLFRKKITWFHFYSRASKVVLNSKQKKKTIDKTITISFISQNIDLIFNIQLKRLVLMILGKNCLLIKVFKHMQSLKLHFRSSCMNRKVI